MAVEKKKIVKKVLRIIVIILIINVVIQGFVTKLVYDSVFSRYESGVHKTCIYKSQNAEACSFLTEDNVMLSGALFKSGGEALIVIAQGINSHGCAFSEEIDHFLSEGYDVFIFDMTGSGASDGESAVGFSRAALDLDCALSFIEREYDYSDVLLLGHSRGGYGALCALAGDHRVSAVVSVNGVNSAMEAVISPAEEKIGPLAYFNYPMLWLYQVMLFGREAVDLTGIDAINSSSVPVLIVESEEDEVLFEERCSIGAHRDEIARDGVEFFKIEGGHSAAFSGELDASLMDKINGFYRECLNGR